MYKLEIHNKYENQSSMTPYYMPNFTSADDVPWKDYEDKIRKVFFSKGVRGIGAYAFAGCTSLEEAEFEYYDFSYYVGSGF